MSDLVRKIRVAANKGKERSPILTKIEQRGDPYQIAAEFLNLHVGESESQVISYPRASSVHDACMRMHVIGSVEGSTVKRWGSLKSAMTFGFGDALHYWSQNTNSIFGDKRRGWWKCLACGRVRYFGKPPQKSCKCGASPDATIYFEHAIKIKKPWKVTGHVDMFFEPIPQLFRAAEIKSLSGDLFPNLLAPYIQHVWQLQTYLMSLPHDSKIPVTIDDQVGYIIYLSKKEHANLFPVKVFPVTRNDLIVSQISDKLLTYKKGVKAYPKRLPSPIDECEKKQFDCYRARYCPALKSCTKFYKEGLC